MIESIIIDYCKCCMIPADQCANSPPPELTYEVEIPLKGVKTDGGHTRNSA